MSHIHRPNNFDYAAQYKSETGGWLYVQPYESQTSEDAIKRCFSRSEFFKTDYRVVRTSRYSQNEFPEPVAVIWSLNCRE